MRQLRQYYQVVGNEARARLGVLAADWSSGCEFSVSDAWRARWLRGGDVVVGLCTRASIDERL